MNWDEFYMQTLMTTVYTPNPPAGFIRFTNGGEPVCPGCYYDPETDLTWDPSTQEVILSFGWPGQSASTIQALPRKKEKPKPPDTRPSCFEYGLALSFGLEAMTMGKDAAIEGGAGQAASVLASKQLRGEVNAYLDIWGAKIAYSAFKTTGKFITALAEKATILWALYDIYQQDRKMYQAIQSGSCVR